MSGEERIRELDEQIAEVWQGGEGSNHLYEPCEQPDGSIIYAHASAWGADGYVGHCPACLETLRLRELKTSLERPIEPKLT